MKNKTVKLRTLLSAKVQTIPWKVIIVSAGENVAVKSLKKVLEINKVSLVLAFRIPKPKAKSTKLATASKVSLVFANWLSRDWTLVNSVKSSFTSTLSKVTEFTWIVELDAEEKNVVSVKVRPLTNGKRVKTRRKTKA